MNAIPDIFFSVVAAEAFLGISSFVWRITAATLFYTTACHLQLGLRRISVELENLFIEYRDQRKQCTEKAHIMQDKLHATLRRHSELMTKTNEFRGIFYATRISRLSITLVICVFSKTFGLFVSFEQWLCREQSWSSYLKGWLILELLESLSERVLILKYMGKSRLLESLTNTALVETLSIYSIEMFSTGAYSPICQILYIRYCICIWDVSLHCRRRNDIA